MPYLKFDSSNGTIGNKASCTNFAEYLNKQDFTENPLKKEFFFNHESQLIPTYEVIESIDNNRKGLSKNEAKFYTGSINFSEEEIQFIGNDPSKIKSYTSKIMEQYALQFDRGITINDLNWYGKIEYCRYFKGDDEEVKMGMKAQGETKPGIHVHFIIGHRCKNDGRKVSPKTNHRDTQKGPVKGGFNRDEFWRQSELIFDQMFGYLRPLEESYHYNNTKVNGGIDDKILIEKMVANEKVKKCTFANQSIEQKEYRIRQLANYICHGVDKNNLKRIDTDDLLQFEKQTDYNGYIYRSLVNLNRMCKQGKTPNEYDLTQKVIGFASYLESKQDSHHNSEISKPVSFIQEKSVDTAEAFSNSLSSSISSSNNHYEDDFDEMQRRKKKKKKPQERDQDMSM